MLSDQQISDILKLVEKAGREISRIYNLDDFKVRIKEDDSPVTIADMASDEIIKSGLSEITPGVPVFSEESKDVDFSTRSLWNPLWILDPLDGTKEFIARNGEFCISLALVLDNQPIAGFIHAPIQAETWIAFKGKGANKISEGKKVKLPFLTPSGAYRINISRHNYTEKEAEWIANFSKDHESIISIQGSAVKFCKIAEGITDVYPKFSSIHEWDIAAGHIILEESGGKIIETESRRSPVYNKEDYFQSSFIAFGARIRNWENLV